jgi:rod shape determining protein RodA
MRRIFRGLGDFFHKADMLLLLLCVVTTVFGIVVIGSATAYRNTGRYVTIQTIGLAIGVVVYIIFTLLDIDIIAERRELLLVFSMVFILMLIPFGTGDSTGNRSWLPVPFIGISMQPGEICKVLYILIIAKLMSVNQNHISSVWTILKLLAVTAAIAGLNLVISSDLGVTMSYAGILVVMLLTGGVSLMWFAAGIGGAILAIPVAWQFLREDQKNRILVIFDPSLDESGLGTLWQTNLGKSALTGGGLTGQGLFNGNLTQSGSIPAQQTDYIFTVIGEELGMAGCLAVLLLLFAIILRCIYVGIRSKNYMNRQICFGIAGMLLFQIFINVGVCLGILPVIGLTLPFLSYGGSSIVTMFLAMGIVSGIHMRPAPDANARYIRLSPVEGSL